MTRGAPMTQDGRLTQIAYDRISAAIVDGRLNLGEPLSEAELAKALGMSRSPVRNAIGALSLRGLVDIVPQSGTYVFNPTRQQIIAVSEFRLVLEEQGLRQAMIFSSVALLAALAAIVGAMDEAWAIGDALSVKQLDIAFHRAFLEHAGNEYLMAAYADISLLVDALRHRFMNTPTYRDKTYDEHLKMLQLLQAGRIEKAVALLSEHVDRTKETMANVILTNERSSRKFYKKRDYGLLLTGPNGQRGQAA
jgi:DNA-binding GntR family transcriptional regulator